ncbi:MAG: hypothetical protein B6242_11755 [Anaerolineaceae bacterium 4572_78]|nr:MAG: hypothetical protein B6242_11755 [Anaerolineaceae bacterium 4572_78]
MKKTILVTGVAGYWGARVAAQLVTEPEYHVIGLDTEPPTQTIKELDFVQADIRDPALLDLLKSEKVNTVCHLLFDEQIRVSERAFDLNVMGTMKLLGACAESEISQIVMKSSMMVYGARYANSSFLPESHPLKGSRRYGYIRHMTEIEEFCDGFDKEMPELGLTRLRFAGIVGPTAITPMTRFLRSQWAPILLGFDPIMQVIHENDVVAAIVHSIVNEISGVFNIACENTLSLFQMIRLAGKFPMPVLHPLAYRGASLLGGRKKQFIPLDLDYIRYPWVGALEKMQNELGFTPKYTAEEVLREFAHKRNQGNYHPAFKSLSDEDMDLNDVIEERQYMSTTA